MSDFWQKTISPGYYDQILQKGLKKERGIQSNWHRSTFIEVSSFINSKDIHLDYACGPGTFSGIFLETNSIGVDISDAQIKYANQTYGKKDKFLSLEEFNKTMSNKKFDVVTVLGLFEFIDDDEVIKLVDKLHELLNEGGKLIATTPNYGGLMYYLELILSKFGKLDYQNEHINRFNNKRLKELLQQTKFEKITIKKHINFGIFSSFISHKFSDKLTNLINNIFKNYFGYILVVKMEN